MDEDRRDWRLEVREGIMQHFNSQGHQKPLLRISKANSGVTFFYFDIIMFDFHVKASEKKFIQRTFKKCGACFNHLPKMTI